MLKFSVENVIIPDLVQLKRNTTMFFECCMTGKQMGLFQSVLNFVTDHQILRIPVKGQFMRGGIQGNGRYNFVLIFIENVLLT